MEAYLGEFIGTMLLIILGDGVVAGVLLRNSKAENSGWIVITLGWGMAVAVAVYCTVDISGAFINTLVPLAMVNVAAHYRATPRGLRGRGDRVAGLSAPLGRDR